ncbi:flagellar hook-length control protein FliK [Frigoriglobus tundricola]|uniref:Flagellar hook-length control protein-like C-terminal domain-containing protein n=1 Tax=Frigoriglobus tundricola TaxID=2774151 RepID=A0A6M5YM55_9BACT|nr:flagellar hook-length control protein FliK [Frigoriglobus tundricola]QJW94416.1 hypothetical protein FTUN_1936 [Frigoriglobus tundricola]
MQVPAASAVAQPTVPVVAGQPAQVLAGNLATLPIGALLQATVSGVTPREAVLTVNGQTLTVRTPPGVQLHTGAVFFVRVPPNATSATNPTLELGVPSAAPQSPQTPTAAQSQLSTSVGNALTNTIGRSVGTATTTTAPATGATPPLTAPPAAPPRLAVVDVLAQLPNGNLRVQIDGGEQTATPSEPLVTGGRYVLQVSQTASGLALKSPPDSPTLPADVAIAVLRNPVPTFVAALKPLQAELAALTARPTNTPQTTTTQPSGAQQPTIAAQPAGATQPTATVLTTLTALLATGDPTTSTPAPAGVTQLATTALTPNSTLATNPAAQNAANDPTTSTPAPAGATRLAAALTPTGPTLATSPAVQKAANAVLNTLSTFLPSDSRPLNATELQNLIENGGLHFEAKLARLTDPTATTTQKPAPATASNTAATKPTPTASPIPAREPNTATGTPGATSGALSGPPAQTGTTAHLVGPDLKGDLLGLLQAVQNLGGAAAGAPAAAAALGGLEAQQATNALAQSTGAPYYLQVPFPDGAIWRTLHLSLEPQNQSTQSDSSTPSGRFRVFMHVPLTDLGETWIDAGVAGDQLRATIYLDQTAVRDRVQAALPELQTQLQADGFSEVLLSVKSSSDLPDRYRREAGAMQAGRPASVSLLDVKA